jgi:hypothetical protein
MTDVGVRKRCGYDAMCSNWPSASTQQLNIPRGFIQPLSTGGIQYVLPICRCELM